MLAIKGSISAQFGLDAKEEGCVMEAPARETEEFTDVPWRPKLQAATPAEGSGDPDNVQAKASGTRVGSGPWEWLPTGP